MDVLILIPELGYGGAERSAMALAKGLRKEHSVKMVLFQEQYASGGYTPIDIPPTLETRVLEGSADGRFQRWLKRWRSLRRQKKKADVCISFLSGTNLLNALCPVRRCPAIVSVRGSRLHDPNLRPLERMIWKRLLDPITMWLAAHIVAISPGIRNELRAYIPLLDERKVTVIPAAISLKELEEALGEPLDEAALPARHVAYLVGIGRLSREKGFQYLLGIVSEVRKQDDRLKLVLIGDGPMASSLAKRAKTLGLSVAANLADEAAHVYLLGYRRNPVRYLRIATVFALPSEAEGLGTILLDALGSPAHILAADCPWGPRYVMGMDLPEFDSPVPEPIRSPVGTLMPLLRSDRAKGIWKDELLAILHGERSVPDMQARKHRLAAFRTEAVMSEWLSLLGSDGSCRPTNDRPGPS